MPCSWVLKLMPNTRMFISAGMEFCTQSWSLVQPAAACWALFHGRLALKTVTCGGWSKVLKRKDVTMPKEDPAPRRAQNRSGFSV